MPNFYLGNTGPFLGNYCQLGSLETQGRNVVSPASLPLGVHVPSQKAVAAAAAVKA